MKLAEKLESASMALTRAEESHFDRIEFEFEGITLFATSDQRETGGAIELSGTLGRLFYTVENSAERTMAIERISAANRGIDGAYWFDKKGHVHFKSLTATDAHMVGDELMSALTLIILEAEPHLRAIHSHLEAI